MSKKAKRVLAIIALVFMGVFTITFIIWLSAPHLLNGQFGFWALFSGAMGIGLFLVVKLVKTPQEKQEEIEKFLPKEDADGEKNAADAEPAGIEADENIENAPSGASDATIEENKQNTKTQK